MTHTTPQSETSTDGGQAATVPAKPATLMITAIAAVLALAGAAILTLGFASQRADTQAVASSPIPQVLPAAESVGAQTTPPLDDDAALVAALADAVRGQGNALYDDPDCMAQVTVTTLGGAAAAESDYGITVTTVPNGIGDLELPKSQAQALTEGYFDECGLQESLVSLLFLGQLEGDEAMECGLNRLDYYDLRDVQALGFMNQTDRAAFAQAAEDAFGASFASVVSWCGAQFGPPPDNDDLQDQIAAFEALVTPLGFEFAGSEMTGFAEVCLHPHPALRFFEYQRGTTRVSMIAGAPNGLEASEFYDYLTQGPYDCDFDEVLLNFLHVGVDGEFDVVDPYMWAVFRHPDEQVPRYEEYVRRGGFVYVASGLDQDEVEELRVLLRGTGPVG